MNQHEENIYQRKFRLSSTENNKDPMKNCLEEDMTVDRIKQLNNDDSLFIHKQLYNVNYMEIVFDATKRYDKRKIRGRGFTKNNIGQGDGCYGWLWLLLGLGL